MSERGPGYNPTEPKTPEQRAQAEGALNEAQALVDQEEAAKAEAQKTGAQNLEIPEDEIDNLFGDLEKGDGEGQ